MTMSDDVRSGDVSRDEPNHTGTSSGARCVDIGLSRVSVLSAWRAVCALFMYTTLRDVSFI